MTIAKEEKTGIIEKFRRSDKDSGSPEVQIALLSNRIQNLTVHFKTHKKDNHSRRSLIAMVNNRRKLLKYVKKEEVNRYKKIIEALGIRK